MPVKIRLARHGKKHNAFYHIVVASSRAPRNGNFIEKIGTYNPNTNPATIDLDTEKAMAWLQKGAQPTDTTRAILSYTGVTYKNHLQRGVSMGKLTQEQADANFAKWTAEREGKITSKKSDISEKNKEIAKNNLALELKAKEAKAEEVRIKNTPPPVVEAEAAPAPEANEAASAAPEAEAPASPEAEAPATPESEAPTATPEA